MKFLIFALCVVAAAADPHWMMLDSREVAAVKSTWKEVKDNEVEILAAIFKAYPDIQSKFPLFAGKTLNTIKTTAPFALHATRIVSFMTTYIGLLGTETTQPAIKTILNEMGQNHRNRGVTKAQFNEFRSALMTYMKTHSTWNDTAAHAWEDCMDKMFYVIFSSMDGHPIS